MRKSLLWIFAVGLYGVCAAAYSPIIDGALADVRIRVVDDMGEAVPDATISVTLYTAPEKVDVKRGKTDAEGCFSAKGQCIGEAHTWIRKDGYYETKAEPKFRTLSDKEAEQQRKWSNGTVDTVVVLKKKRNPVDLAFKFWEYRKFPATNEVLKLDLEMLDWCPPYGKGRHDDLHMVFDGWRNPKDWYDFHEHLSISFPNCVDGFYRRTADMTSGFRYDYAASTNEVYKNKLDFRFARVMNGVTNRVCLAKDEYLVYRVRTQTNELGQVTHAHYGRIGEGISQQIGLSIRSWFNKKDNDTNLENARAW